MKEFLINFFIDGFSPGDYTYGFIHISSVILLLILLIGYSYWFRRKDEKAIRRSLKPLAIIVLTIYIVRKIIASINSGNPIETFWPFYLCNINTIFISLYIIFNLKKGQDFFLITGLLGGIITFALADGIYNDKYITFNIIDSVLSHYIIIIVPFVLLKSRNFVIKPKSLIIVFIGLLITVINSEFIQPLLFKTKNDYLFLRGVIPFTIPNVPQFFIISSLTIIFILLLYGLDTIYIKTYKKYTLIK